MTKPGNKPGKRPVAQCEDCGEKFTRFGALAEHGAADCIARLKRLVAEGRMIRG